MRVVGARHQLGWRIKVTMRTDKSNILNSSHVIVLVIDARLTDRLCIRLQSNF